MPFDARDNADRCTGRLALGTALVVHGLKRSGHPTGHTVTGRRTVRTRGRDTVLLRRCRMDWWH